MSATSRWGFKWFSRLVCLAGLEVMLTSRAAAERGAPAFEGIGNFGKVNERLYRGAEPDTASLRNLQRLGVKSIIDLRQAKHVWKAEAALARANGIAYTNVPLSGVRAPTCGQVEAVLNLIETLPCPIFIHCQHGCDRTGTIVACYRLRHDGWSLESAQKEADRFGMSKLVPGMRKLVAKFARN